MTASAVSTFPTTIDAPQAPTQFDNLATPNVEHDLLHDWAQDAIKKIEAKLGINTSPDTTSIDYVLKNHQHQGTDRSAQFAAIPIKMVASQVPNPLEVRTSLGVLQNAITPAGEYLGVGPTAASLAIRSYVTGDTFDRFQVQADGTIKWGAGTATPATVLARTGVGQLQLTSQLGIGIAPTTFALDVSGTTRVSGALTATAGMTASGGNIQASAGDFKTVGAGGIPRLYLKATDAATNGKVWDIMPLGGNLIFRTINDAENATTTWLTAIRSG